MLNKKSTAVFASLVIVALLALPGLQAGDRLDIPHRAWPGTYRGRIDGRRARLRISTEYIGESAHQVVYKIVLEDLDRGGKFSGEVTVNNNKTPKNVIPFPNP